MDSMCDRRTTWGRIAWLVLLTAGCGESTLLEVVESRGELVVAIDPFYPPQSLLASDGTWSGYDVEVAREIGARLGVDVRIESAPWDEVLAGHWRGRWDIAVDSMTKTYERDRVLEFVDPPYRYDSAYFFTRSASGVPYANITPSTLLCTSADTSYSAWFEGQLFLLAGSIYVAPPTPSTLSLTAQTCAESVVAGTYDLFVDSYGGALPSLQAGDVVATGPKLFDEHIFITMDRSSPANGDSLRARVSAIVQAMRDDGTLSGISNDAYGVDLSVGGP